MKKVKQNKQQINNPTFRNEFELRKLVNDSTCVYNETQNRRMANVLRRER